MREPRRVPRRTHGRSRVTNDHPAHPIASRTRTPNSGVAHHVIVALVDHDLARVDADAKVCGRQLIPQNFALGLNSASHVAQRAVRRLPHSAQKRAPSGFDSPHCPHTMPIAPPERIKGYAPTAGPGVPRVVDKADAP
jgi:hypothetical protein